MSLNPKERQETARELSELRASLSVTDEQLSGRLGYDTAHLARVLGVTGVDPGQVWQLRDFMVAIARQKGLPVPAFSKLKEKMRPMAKIWFGSWEVPSTDGL